MEGILGAFQSSFPSLYAPAPEPEVLEPGAGEDGESVRKAEEAPKAETEAIPEAEPELSPEPDPYTQKISQITTRFEKMRSLADELEQYLKTADQSAKESEFKALAQADEDFTPAWRNTGLPMKPSHLRLDQSKMEGGRLVNPKSIMSQYEGLRQKEVLNPPKIYEYNDTSIEPNYLKMTNTLKSRNAMISPEKTQRVQEATMKNRTWHTLAEEEVKQRINQSEERRKIQDLKMPAAQFEAEKKVIKNMNQKLSFLRNPRYPLPPAVQMLTSKMKKADAKLPPIKANMTAHPEIIFVAEPGVVMFTDYVIGEVYQRRVRIRNVTNVARNLRCFPPASQYFHMSLLRFPQDKGIVAPGMAAEVIIRFCPDSLADFDDNFTVDTALARFLVPIQARRPPPSLNLPPAIDVGEVLAGNRKVTNINFSNAGGAGRFRIIPESYWPKNYANAPVDVAQVGPFQVWPLFLDMQPGDEVSLSVAYEPQSIGSDEERLLIVCDNCQVNSFLLKGTATNVDIVMKAVDGKVVETGKVPAAPIWFGEVVPESSFTRKVTVQNTTTLPFPFKWTMASYPQTQAASIFNSPNGDGMMQTDMDFSRTDYDDLMGEEQELSIEALNALAAATAQTGSGGYGKVDLVALGEGPPEDIAVFFVVPVEGVLQPGEALDFSVTFVPSRIGRVERWTRLMVDRTTPGMAPKGCDVTVLEIGLEGMGSPLNLEVMPRRVIIPGSLTPSAVATQYITVKNPTRAPAVYEFESLDPDCVLKVSPVSGVISPLSSIEVELALTAPEQPGSFTTALQLNVAHGPPLLVEMEASVCPPGVEFCTSVLNFGLVRLNDSCTFNLKLRNTSTTCHTKWSVEELIAELQEHSQAGSEAASRTGDAHEGESTPPQKPRQAGGETASETGDAEEGESTLPTEGAGKTYLSFKPPAGDLAPGQEVMVEATLHALSDGHFSSTLRLHAPGADPCLSVLAAVVTPAVALSPPKIDLGSAYVGVVVKKSVQIRNLSLLPLDYSFSIESPLENPFADLKIRPSHGRLQPGELQELQIRYSPLAVGRSVLMGVCDINGAPNPAGFLLESEIKDMDVMYELLSEAEYTKYKADFAKGKKKRNDVDHFVGMTHLPPSILSKISSVRSPGSPPTPFPLGDKHLVANFGEAVPLGETRHQYLIITNRTPIHTMVHTWLDYFGVEDATKLTKTQPLAGSKPDLGGARIQKSKYTPIKLSDEAEKLRPFRAEEDSLEGPGGKGIAINEDSLEGLGGKGVAINEDSLEGLGAQGVAINEDSEEVLGAKGIAINVGPPVSTLGPWSRLELPMACFNDMCGDYFDMLHIKRDRVLIKGLKDRCWRTNLEFGEIPVGVELEKTFYVFNTGGLDMHLSWEFRRFQDESDFDRPGAKVIDFDFRVEEPASSDKQTSDHIDDMRQSTDSLALTPQPVDGQAEAAPASTAAQREDEWMGRLKVKLNTHAEADVKPYVVEPSEKVLKGGESAMFTVRFVSDRSVPHQGYMCGIQRVSSPDAPLQMKTWLTGDKADGVGVLFSGTFHPHAGFPPSPLQPLRVDLESTGVVSRLEPDSHKDLQFVCHSVHKPSTHRSYKQIITMSNRQTCPLIFTVNTDGPFQLLSATPSAPQDPTMYAGTTGTMSNFHGKTYLPAKETVDVEVQFCPPKKDEFQDYHLSGELIAEFANGDIQILPLVADVLHPQTEVKPDRLDFGRLHVQSPKPIVVVLSNPSEVDAYWAVTTEGSKPKYFTKQELAAGGEANRSEAKFGPFIIQPAGGMLPGRGLGMPRTQHITVTFAPSEAKDFDQQVVFAVNKGRTCSLSMLGTGSFDERDEHQAKLFGV
eukprot:gene24309-9913_t